MSKINPAAEGPIIAANPLAKVRIPKEKMVIYAGVISSLDLSLVFLKSDSKLPLTSLEKNL